MNTLLVVDTETSDFKYAVAMAIFRTDMVAIDRGIELELAYDPTAMNMYIDEAIRLLH